MSIRRLELMGTDTREGSRWLTRRVRIVHIRQRVPMHRAGTGDSLLSELPTTLARGR